MLHFLLVFCFLLSFLFLFFKSKSNTNSSSIKPHPILGHHLSIKANQHRRVEWTTEAIHNSPTSTTVFLRPFGQDHALSGNPAVVEHITKTNFSNYQKGVISHHTIFDFLGHGIFNVDGDAWKSQRQVYTHAFSTKSLRHFVEHVVETELNERLLPILSTAAANDAVIDLQDILQRFALDNICKTAFDYDPASLTPSMPPIKFALGFDDALRITIHRFLTLTPIWKIKRLLSLGSEKRLKEAKSDIREFTNKILSKPPASDNSLLSRLISSGHANEGFVTDVLINLIFAGRDTTPAALTWFFWLLYKNPGAESEVVKEINKISGSPGYDELKEMVYTHASLCESLRFYPPVPIVNRTAMADDVLPDGTVVKKGMTVGYHPYAMGRMEKLWGGDWKEFRPERWLVKDDQKIGNMRFKERDPYTFPVFHAGPRICMGKDMSILQMKKVAAGVLRRFKVVPVMDDGREPVLITAITSKMKGGFPVKIKERK